MLNKQPWENTWKKNILRQDTLGINGKIKMKNKLLYSGGLEVLRECADFKLSHLDKLHYQIIPFLYSVDDKERKIMMKVLENIKKERERIEAALSTCLKFYEDQFRD